MPSTILFIVATLLLSLNHVRPFGLAVSDWLYFGALGFALLETFLMQRRHTSCWWQNRFLWAVALILIGAIISTMNSQDWFTALVEIFQQTFVMTLFVSLTWIMVRRDKTKTILLAFILSGGLAAGIVLTDYLTGSRLGPVLSGTPNIQLWGRFAGPLGHPNKLGYFLVLTTLLSLGQLMNIKSTRFAFPARLLWGVLTAVQIFAIYLSGSLSAYLGLITGFILFVLSSKMILNKVTRTLGVAAAAVTLVIAFWFIATPVLISDLPAFKENSIVRAFNRVQTDTAGSRMATYAQAWDEITQNPWFGVGYDQISTSGVSASSRFLDFSVHNPLLQIWYTGGIFAFIGWTAVYLSIAWMAVAILRNAWQRPLSPYILGLAVATLALLLMDQFQDSIYQREKWLVIGLLCGIAWENITGRAAEAEPVDLNGSAAYA
jgi:O-antigen ligase